jgi:Bacterial archaeo-eukaryotic release factor family 10
MKRRSRSDSATGVMLVSADGATIAEWHPRKVEEVSKLELDLPEAAAHELVGPSYSHPRGAGEKASAARSSAQRDLWQRRVEDHRVRFARSAAADAARAAKRRGWDLVLVLGDPRRAGPACEELRRQGVEAVRSALVLDWLRPAALATRLAPEVERARAELARDGPSRR